MELNSLFLRLLALLAVCETRQLRPTVVAPSQRGSWRRKASVSISVPKGPRARSMAQPNNNKLTHSLSLNNLNLAPGETKVIRQTLVVRRRPNGSKKQTRSKTSPSSRRGGGGRRGLYAVPNASRFTSGSGQRGAHPSGLSSLVASPPTSLFLLSKMQPGHLQSNPVMGQRNGMATLQLPVIDLGAVAATRPSPVSGNIPSHHAPSHNAPSHHTPSQHAPGQHANIGRTSVNSLFGAARDVGNVHGGIPKSRFGGSVVSVNELISAGVSQADIASVLLAGNPNVLVIQDHVSTPGSAHPAVGHNTNILSSHLIRNNKIGQPAAFSKFGTGHSTLNSHLKPNNVGTGHSTLKTHSIVVKTHTLRPVQTTMEPGEDPPEAP